MCVVWYALDYPFIDDLIKTFNGISLPSHIIFVFDFDTQSVEM